MKRIAFFIFFCLCGVAVTHAQYTYNRSNNRSNNRSSYRSNSRSNNRSSYNSSSYYGNSYYGNSYGSNSRSNSRSGGGNRGGGSKEIEYPLKCNMIGLVGGVFITSNPDMSGYDTKKNYVDGGGGMVYDHRHEFSEYGAYEVILSGMMSSCKTSRSEDGETKMKVILPIETRFYVGFSQLKMYLGGGFQYNFIWSSKRDGYGNYQDEDASAQQLSANMGVGLCVLGLSSKVHFLLGTKFHFPLVNNAEGVEYSESDKIDFSKDKTSIVATGGMSFDIGQSCVVMLNYDYPLGNTAMTTIDTGETRSFFQRKSQSFTLNLMIRL